MKWVGKYALVITNALFCGAFMFSATFVLMDFGCRYLIKPKNVTPGVIGAGFLLGVPWYSGYFFYALPILAEADFKVAHYQTPHSAYPCPRISDNSRKPPGAEGVL